MTPTELRALADRVEALTGPDREIDAEIGMAMGLKNTMRVGHECLGTDRVVPVRCPAYSASLDAALTLVPGGWPSVQIGTTDDGRGYAGIAKGYGQMMAEVPEEGYASCEDAASMAIALTAAALRAHAAMMEE
jgi:hypothetical protein